VLSAPFVFLGPQFDEILFNTYSELSNQDICRPQFLSGIFGGTAILDVPPLKELIGVYITAKIFNDTAIEHRKKVVNSGLEPQASMQVDQLFWKSEKLQSAICLKHSNWY